MSASPYTQAKQHIRNAHDHIQMSNATATDPNIIEALGEILDAIRILAKEADSADTVLRQMDRP
jgi:hypothetical protein